MNIKNHPVWEQITPYATKVAPFKKPFHLARIYLAKAYAKLYPRSLFIGVTGSVGKTTTVLACKLVLSQKNPVLSTEPNLDPIFNIPITLLSLRPKFKKVILEMGVEYLGEMDFYLSLVAPKTAIITSIAYQHSEFLGGLQEISKEKGKLIDALPSDGLAILNYDDINVRKLAENFKGELIFIGKDPEYCQVWASNIRIENFVTCFELNCGVERVKVEYPLLGEHQIYSALNAAALGLSEGMNLINIKNALEKMRPPEHRLEALPGFGGSIILDDTYNGSPVSFEAGLDALQQISARRRIVVLGEMRELGHLSKQMHQKIAQIIFKNRVDLVFLGTGDANIIAEELKGLGFLPEKMETNLQNPQIVSKLLKVLSKGDVCLIKGARGVRLDEVVKKLTKKTYD